jgi:hypothetical protein
MGSGLPWGPFCSKKKPPRGQLATAQELTELELTGGDLPPRRRPPSSGAAGSGGGSGSTGRRWQSYGHGDGHRARACRLASSLRPGREPAGEPSIIQAELETGERKGQHWTWRRSSDRGADSNSPRHHPARRLFSRRPARPRRGGAEDATGCAPDLSKLAHFLPASLPMLTRAQIPATSSADGGSGRATVVR